MHSHKHSVAASVAADLSEAIESLATDLRGGPPQHRTRTELRFGENGRVRVTVAGRWRGHFTDFGSGQRGDALDFVAYCRQCSPPEALAWARAWLGTPQVRQAAKALPARDHAAALADDAEHRAERAAVIWRQTEPVQGSVAETYLHGRGLAVRDGLGDIRFHPKCPRGPFVAPAMVSLLRDLHTGEPCGIHRTYLCPDGNGKADRQAKRMLGRAGGAAVMLSGFAEVTTGLAICEGIETGLALMGQGTGPLWATGSATSIRTFPVLDGIEALTIYADADAAGLGAAEVCAERWQAAGREVAIVAPPEAGSDWLDVIARRAAA